MTALKSLTVDVTVTEEGDRTLATAALHDHHAHLHGRGTARRNPIDPQIPEVGDELAVSRALADLAQRLLQTASQDLEAITGTPLSLQR